MTEKTKGGRASASSQGERYASMLAHLRALSVEDRAWLTGVVQAKGTVVWQSNGGRGGASPRWELSSRDEVLVGRVVGLLGPEGRLQRVVPKRFARYAKAYLAGSWRVLALEEGLGVVLEPRLHGRVAEA